MNVKDNIPPAIIGAATSMLQEFIPELSPVTLVNALRLYGNQSSPNPTRSEYLTRADAAKILRISLPTLDRYIASGLLERSKLSPRNCRIKAEAVYNLLEHGRVSQ